MHNDDLGTYILRGTENLVLMAHVPEGKSLEASIKLLNKAADSLDNRPK